MRTTKLSVLLLLVFSEVCFCQNFAIRWHSLNNASGFPTNCIEELRDIRGSTSLPQGFHFITNATGVRFYTLFSETNFSVWNNSNTVALSSNRAFWLSRREMHLSNVLWYSTNISVLNSTLGSSNLLMLRAAEERLK